MHSFSNFSSLSKSTFSRSARSSRRLGRRFRSWFRDLFVPPYNCEKKLAFQCKSDCPLSLGIAPIEVPHCELALMEIAKDVHLQSRSARRLLDALLAVLPGGPIDSSFRETFRSFVNGVVMTRFSNVETACNQSLFAPLSEFVLSEMPGLFRQAGVSVLCDELFKMYDFTSRVCYLETLVSNFSLTEGTVEILSDLVSDLLENESCSFNVDLFPTMFNEALTEMFVATVVSINSILWVNTRSEVKIPDSALTLLNKIYEDWSSNYSSGVSFQSGNSQSMPGLNEAPTEHTHLFARAVSGITNAFTRVGRGVTNVEETLQNVNDLTSNVSELTENLNEDYGSLRGMLGNFMSFIKPSEATVDLLKVLATRVLPLVLFVIAFTRYTGFVVSCLKYLAVAIMTYYGGQHIVAFVALFHKILATNLVKSMGHAMGLGASVSPEEDEVHLQAGEFGVAKDLIDLLRPILNIKRFDVNDPLESFVEVLTNVDPHVSEANKLLFITTRVSELWSKLSNLIGWYKPDYSQFCTGYDDVDIFCREVISYLGEEDPIPTKGLLASVEKLYNMSAVLRNKYEKNQAVNRILSEHVPKLQAMLVNLRKMNFDSKSYRVEPVSLVLVSEPGLGKTTAMEIINNRLIRYALRNNKEALELFKSRPKEYLYPRNTSPFWEGVSNHIVTVYYADYLSGKAEVTGVSHEAELMDLIGPQQFTPNMAFEQKGKVDVRPHYVTMGTNERKVRGEGAHHKNAVARRMNVYKLLWTGPGAKPTPGMRLDSNYWKFQPHKFNEAYEMVVDESKPTLDLDEIVQITILKREMLVRKMMALRQVIDAHEVKADETLAVNISKVNFLEGQDEYDLLKIVRDMGDHVDFQSGMLLSDYYDGAYFTSYPQEPQDCIEFCKLLDHTLLNYCKNQSGLKETVKKAYDLRSVQENIPVFISDSAFEAHWTKCEFESILKMINCDVTFSDSVSLVTKSMFRIGEKAVRDFTNVVKQLVYDNSLYIAGAVIAAASYFAMAGSFTSEAQNVGEDKPVYETQAKTYLDETALRRSKEKKHVRSQKIKLVKVEHQSSTAIPVALNKAAYHTFSLRSFGVHFQSAIALQDRVFFINYHAYLKLKKAAEQEDASADYEFQLVNESRGITTKVLLSDMAKGVKDQNSDLLFFLAPEAPQSTSILPHWVSDQFIVDRMDTSSVKTGVGCVLHSAKGPQFYGSSTLINGKNVNNNGEAIFIRQLWRCVFLSEAGDCGGLYFSSSNDGGNAGKFLGFHSMGSDGFGASMGCAVTKTTLKSAIGQLIGLPEPDDEAGRDVIGEGERSHYFNTTITDIPVALEAPYERKLASVQCNDPKVYIKAVSKYNKTVPLSEDLKSKLRESVSNVLQHWQQVQTESMRSGSYDLRTAIVGLPGTSFESIDLSTSPGYPHNCTSALESTKTKKQLVGCYENGEFVEGALAKITQEEVKNCLLMLSRGEVPMWIYTDVIKSETLPKEKVADHKGRLVSAAPNSLVLVTRMLFGPFMRWMKDNHLVNGFAGGDNMEGPDAHIITMQHKTVAADQDLHIAGDLSGYDTRHGSDHLEIALQCIVDFIRFHNPDMAPSVVRMYETYVKSLSFTYHIRGKTVHRWVGSLPSGHPLTTILNSVLNHGYFSYSVWKASGFKPKFWEWYFKNFVVRVLGDDNRASCSPQAKEYLSEAICASGYADFGHVYTDDTKTGLNSAFRPFEKTTLLKRSTRYESILGMYVAPLRIDVIEELPLWTRAEGSDRVPSDEQAIKNVETAVRYLSYHEDSEWDRLIPLWEKMYSELGWKCPYVSRASCLKACFGSDDFEIQAVA